MISADELVDAGILEQFPPNYSASQFCMAIVSQFLADTAELGAALLQIDSRGCWKTLGGFRELEEVGEKIHRQPVVKFPVLTTALRVGTVITTWENAHFQQFNPKTSATLTASGLTRPALGVLIIGFSEGNPLSAGALRLLGSTAETFLSRSDFSPAQTGPIAQVNRENSRVIFTERQMKILKLLSSGKTNTEIGKELSISASLAKQEVAFLSHALQARSRLEVVIQAQRQGIPVIDPASV